MRSRGGIHNVGQFSGSFLSIPSGMYLECTAKLIADNVATCSFPANIPLNGYLVFKVLDRASTPTFRSKVSTIPESFNPGLSDQSDLAIKKPAFPDYFSDCSYGAKRYDDREECMDCCESRCQRRPPLSPSGMKTQPGDAPHVCQHLCMKHCGF